MKKVLVSQTNPYLRDRVKRQTGLIASVCSSSAIEGITTANGVIRNLLQKRDKAIPRKPLVSRQSRR